MIRVYIASPYTKPEGCEQENVDRSFAVAIKLIEYGFAPYPPLYSHYLHLMKPQAFETWMKLDMEWVQQCDCLLRLKGESYGADREVEFAQDQGMPVFRNVDDLIDFYSSVEEVLSHVDS